MKIVWFYILALSCCCLISGRYIEEGDLDHTGVNDVVKKISNRIEELKQEVLEEKKNDKEKTKKSNIEETTILKGYYLQTQTFSGDLDNNPFRNSQEIYRKTPLCWRHYFGNATDQHFQSSIFYQSNPDDYIQKLPSKGVLRKRCAENMQQIHRRTPMPKCDFNKEHPYQV